MLVTQTDILLTDDRSIEVYISSLFIKRANLYEVYARYNNTCN